MATLHGRLGPSMRQVEETEEHAILTRL